jgi:hypothetical protein
MLVGLYDKICLSNNNVCHDFLQLIDKNISVPADSVIAKENPSMSAATAQLMAKINRNTKFIVNHTTHYGLACQFASILNVELNQHCQTQYSYFTNSISRYNFLNRFAESNKFVASRYLNGQSFSNNAASLTSSAMSEQEEKLLLDTGLSLLKRIFEGKYGATDGVAKMIGVLWNSELQKELEST